MTFSSAVKLGNSSKDWKTNPTLSFLRIALFSSSNRCKLIPSNTISPLVAVSRPARSPSRVDFPEPEGPVIANDFPSSRLKVISSRMTKLLSPEGTSFLKFFVVRIILN